MSLRTEQAWKEEFPILVTESGIFIAASFAHEEKEFVPILVTEEGMTTFSSEIQFANISSLIFSRFSGSTML